MPSPRTVILVRHGQSEHHVRGLTGGWTDTPMTALGHEQAARVAARLKSELGDAPVRVHTSDLIRAAQTAAAIGEALGATPVPDSRLREHNNGECANLTIEEARARYPEMFGANLPLDVPGYPGAETARALFDRCGAFLDGLEDDGTTPIVVSHGGTIVCLVGQWLQLTAETLHPIGFEALPTSITVLRTFIFQGDPHGPAGRVVQRLNDVAHLEGLEGWAPIGAVL